MDVEVIFIYGVSNSIDIVINSMKIDINLVNIDD
jgi:hypothetical protein